MHLHWAISGATENETRLGKVMKNQLGAKKCAADLTAVKAHTEYHKSETRGAGKRQKARFMSKGQCDSP